jgi:hypothetical protein
MSAHKRLKRKNDDGADEDEENSQSVEDAARLMSLLHRYARENLLLANIYIKVSSFHSLTLIIVCCFNIYIYIYIYIYIIKVVPLGALGY